MTDVETNSVVKRTGSGVALTRIQSMVDDKVVDTTYVLTSLRRAIAQVFYDAAEADAAYLAALSEAVRSDGQGDQPCR